MDHLGEGEGKRENIEKHREHIKKRGRQIETGPKAERQHNSKTR